MQRRRWRRFATIGIMGALLALAATGVAGAHPFGSWSGKKGAFAWQSRVAGCGVVRHTPSVVHAHTRWRTSPSDGYTRLTFIRQIKDEDTGDWATVRRERITTRNTDLQGDRSVIHWTQRFNPFASEAGATSRHIVVFEWFRQRPGVDARALRRERVSSACIVGG
jgi:hypothetical protein